MIVVAVLLLILFQPAKADGFTDKQLQQGMFACEHKQKMAESIQLVRILQRNEFDDFERVLKVLSNAGGPLGQYQTPDQIHVKDAYFQDVLDIAFEVYSFFDIGIAPDRVGVTFQEVCRMEFEANKPDHMEGRLGA